MSDKKPVFNFETGLGDDILNFLQRLEYLEDQQRKIDRFLEMKVLEWDASKSEFSRELHRMKEELAEIKDKSKILKENFISLIMEFRNKANSDDFSKLKNKIDSWKLESFISREEFLKMFNS